MIIDTRSSYTSKAGTGTDFQIKSAYKTSIGSKIPLPPTSHTASKRIMASLDVEDVKKMRKRIHELSFLRKEQERQMEVMSVLDRNFLMPISAKNQSAIGKNSKEKTTSSRLKEPISDIYIPGFIMPKISNKSSFQTTLNQID